VNKWLSAGASIAVIIGVAGAIIGAVVATQTLKQSQQIASSDLVLKLRATLDDSKFAKLVADIQNHDHSYPLLVRSDDGKGGKFSDLAIEQYISVFEDIGYLVEGNLIIGKMAYNEFFLRCRKNVVQCRCAARDSGRAQGRQSRYPPDRPHLWRV
jgi:hypothetical protein